MSQSISDRDLRELVVKLIVQATKNGKTAYANAIMLDFQNLASQSVDPAISRIDWGYPDLHQQWQEKILKIMWDLAAEGLVRPMVSSFDKNVSFNTVEVTEFGRAILQDVGSHFDPDGTLQRLKVSIPTLDPDIVDYLEESMRALRHLCLLSSTVAMGCASEKAMLLLIEATSNALGVTSKKQFDQAQSKARTIKHKNEEYCKWFETSTVRSRLKAEKSTDWLEAFEDAMQLMFAYFRRVRNDAGHPTGHKVSRDAAIAHLMLFPAYLKAIYEAMEWLDANKPI